MIQNNYSSPQLKSKTSDFPAAESRVAPTFKDNYDEHKIPERKEKISRIISPILFASLIAYEYFTYDSTNKESFFSQESKKLTLMFTMGIGFLAPIEGFKDFNNNHKVSGAAKVALGLLSFGAIGYHMYHFVPENN